MLSRERCVLIRVVVRSYATNGSKYRQIPIGVVIPRENKEDIEAGIAVCPEFGAPVLNRGRYESGRSVLKPGGGV